MTSLTAEDLLVALSAAEQARQGEGYVACTFKVPELDPLAVLESLDEPAPRGYFENPSRRRAHAAASPIAEWRGAGPQRFAQADRWLRDLHQQLTCIGGPPRVIATFPFYPGDADDAQQARLFLPAWQVVTEDGITTVTLADKATLGCAARLAIRAEQFRRFAYRPSASASRAPVPTVLSEVGGNWFPQAVQRATELIKEGSFEKIVLTRAFDWRRAEPFNAYATLHRLRRANPPCHAYLVDEPELSLIHI